jgi:hypothetical protein
VFENQRSEGERSLSSVYPSPQAATELARELDSGKEKSLLKNYVRLLDSTTQPDISRLGD